MSKEEREALLVEGKRLADRILHQHRRTWASPMNQEESDRLFAMQDAFDEWEQRAANGGVDVTQIFGDRLRLLRRYKRPISPKPVLSMKKMLNVEPPAVEKPLVGHGGIWDIGY
jgi:hypothetical protein